MRIMRALVSVTAILLLAACGEKTLVLTDVTSPTGSGATTPNFHSAADGRVVMSWLEKSSDSSNRLLVSIRETSGEWSAPTTVVDRSDLFVNWADFPSVVMLADGRLLAHWLQRNGSGRYSYEVRLSESRDNGATWSTSTTPHRPGVPAEHGFVSILPTADSSARIFFLDGGAGLAGAPVPAAGHEEHAGPPMHLSTNAWGSATSELTKKILDTRVCDCCQTASAMTSQGPVLVYRDRSEAEVRDIAVLREVNGAWTEPTRVHADEWTVNYCPVNGPAIVADGEFVAVAWFTGARDTAKVQVAFSTDAGATFGAPTRIDEGTPSGRVGIQRLGNDVLVSWLERSGPDSAFVKVRRVTRDGVAQAPITINATSGARSSGFPRITPVGEGALLAWTLPGTPSIVRMAMLAPQ
jgi:hypothetical protein